jgi:hypothetical protein
MVGRTPGPGDQPVVRPLPTQGNTGRGRNKVYVYASTSILLYENNVRAGENISCLDDMTIVIDLKNLKKYKHFLKPAVGKTNWQNNLITGCCDNWKVCHSNKREFNVFEK